MIVIRRGSNHLYLYKGYAPAALVRRRDRPVAYPTPLGRFDDRRQVEEPVVVPARLALGAGREADSARARATRSARAGWASPRPASGSTGPRRPPRSATRSRTAASACYIPDAEWLFNHVDVGTTVFIVSA